VCKFDIENSEIIEENNNYAGKSLIFFNNNYVCTFSKNFVYVLTPDMEILNKIKINGAPNGFVIDDNKIFMSIYDRFYIYNLKGNLIHSWNLENNPYRSHTPREITTYKNEIYIVDTAHDCVRVYSYEGLLLRSWGKFGSRPGNFSYLWGITIYRGVVFIVDTLNRRIQEFTRHGKFVFENKYGDRNITHIVIANDCVYISDWISCSIVKFKLIYN
jgi:hypothetical protein